MASADAATRLLRDGANDVSDKKAHPLLRFAAKFWGLSAWMLELIAILSLILNKRADFAVALALLLVNAVVSFVHEQRASAAVAALRNRLQITARALCDGNWQSAPARGLVCGDVIRVRSGDFVPADAQIIDGTLQVDQSALSGESRELKKTRVVRWLFVIVGIQVVLAAAVALLRGIGLTEILPLSLALLRSRKICRVPPTIRRWASALPTPTRSASARRA